TQGKAVKSSQPCEIGYFQGRRKPRNPSSLRIVHGRPAIVDCVLCGRLCHRPHVDDDRPLQRGSPMTTDLRPAITVFTPTYNRAHTLPRLYQSLLEQTFRDFEWLI